MTTRATHGRTATIALLAGLAITLVAVVSYSWYITRQISALQQVQRDTADRNRRASLQLLRIQNNLNGVGLAIRDMISGEEPYPLTAWSSQFERMRADFDDALSREEQLAAVTRGDEQRRFLRNASDQFWSAVDDVFRLAREGNEAEARREVRQSLEARQTALTATVARLLVQDNETAERVAQQVQDVYREVQRRVYWFLSAILLAIVVTTLIVIRSNRRLIVEIEGLSEQRHELAQKLIASRESTLRYIARELHDEFGQILTAIGSMLARARRAAPTGSSLGADLQTIAEIAQSALAKVRGLSQALHPSLLEEAGLETAIDWYVSSIEQQFGVKVVYAREGPVFPIDATTGIHVYRVLQAALTNAARHSGADEVRVELRFGGGTLELVVEDHGRGLSADAPRRGLGIIAMQERADLLGGHLQLTAPPGGGTRVQMRVPIDAQERS